MAPPTEPLYTAEEMRAAEAGHDVAGARGVGMRAVLVRTGKFRPDAVETSRIKPDGIVSSIAHLPEWLEEHIA